MATTHPTCRFCGIPLPPSLKWALYCCEQHRRWFQDARRKRERAEERARKKAERENRLQCPFTRERVDSVDDDTDTLTDEELVAQVMTLDPAPVFTEEELLEFRNSKRSTKKLKKQHRKKPKKKKNVWLSLLCMQEEKKDPEVLKLHKRGWKKNWLSLV